MIPKKNPNIKNDLNVFQVLHPLFLWTTLQGLTPFSPKRSGFEKSRSHIICCLLLVGFYSAGTFLAIHWRDFKTKQGLIGNITDYLELYLANLNMIVSILFACIHRNKILGVIEAIYNVDISIKHNLSDVNYKNQRFWRRLCCVLAIINAYVAVLYVGYILIFWNGTFWKTALAAYSFVCPKMICTHVVIQFCALSRMVRRRFYLLNEYLENSSGDHHEHIDFILKDMSNKTTITPNELSVTERIRLHHYRLCEICALLNDAFGVQLLFTALQVFVSLLAGIFYCIRNVALKPESLEGSPFVLILYTINATFLSFAQLWGVCISASKTEAEAKSTGSVIHRFKANQLSKKIEFEMIYFSLQLKQHNVDFNACRMFKLDLSLLLSVIGVICTYLVIVIQFEFSAILRDT